MVILDTEIYGGQLERSTFGTPSICGTWTYLMSPLYFTGFLGSSKRGIAFGKDVEHTGHKTLSSHVCYRSKPQVQRYDQSHCWLCHNQDPWNYFAHLMIRIEWEGNCWKLYIDVRNEVLTFQDSPSLWTIATSKNIGSIFDKKLLLTNNIVQDTESIRHWVILLAFQYY